MTTHVGSVLRETGSSDRHRAAPANDFDGITRGQALRLLLRKTRRGQALDRLKSRRPPLATRMVSWIKERLTWHART